MKYKVVSFLTFHDIVFYLCNFIGLKQNSYSEIPLNFMLFFLFTGVPKHISQ